MAENVVVETSLGSFTIELDREHAPKSTENFLQYVDAGHYTNTLFHRVVPPWMIQGGGYDLSYERKPTRAPIENEGDNGLSNSRGTVAMARTSPPHSATAQFFVNTIDNPNFDQKAKSGAGWGYAVFGRVIDGMDVVDAIAKVPTGAAGSFAKESPLDPVVIREIRRS